MKECIIILACREPHLRVYDPEVLSEVKGRKKILIAGEAVVEILSQKDKECFDEIITVSVRENGPVELFYNKQELVDVIKPYTDKFSPENVYIFAADEFNIPVIADVTTTLGANGYYYEKAEFFRDKALMKSFLRQNSKVKIPEHILLTPLPSYNDLVERLGSPFVAKPVAAAAAAGVKFIHTEKEWEALRKDRDDNFENYEAETFLSGQLFHVDSVRHKGTIIASVVCEYLYPVGNFVYGDPVASILITEEHPLFESIELLNKEVLDAFNENGCFHLECFCDAGKEPVFLEVGWRQAGSPCRSNFEQVYDRVPQSLFHLLAVMDYPLPTYNASPYKKVDFFLSKKKGIFKGLEFPELKSKFTNIDIKIKEGEEVPCEPEMFIDLVASFTLENPNYSKLYQDFISLRGFSFYKS